MYFRPSSIYHRNATSIPICSLASELISRIFLECAEEENACWSLKWIRLMLVCRRFREIGVAHSELWSYISMPMRISSGNAYESYTTRISRAKGWPLSLRLRYDADLAYFLENQATFLWQPTNLKLLVINRNSRSSSGSSFDAFLERLAAAEYPKLQSLSLDSTSSSSPHSQTILRLCSPAIAPALQILSLSFVPIDMQIDLPSLTHFDLSCPLPDQDIVLHLLVFLRRCPKLEALRITEIERRFRNINIPHASDPALLPHLRNIIHFGELPLGNAFLQNVAIPSAESLMMILTSIDSMMGLKELAANVKKYLLGSSVAAAGAHLLEVDRHHFATHTHQDGTMSTSITAGDLPPGVDLEALFSNMVPAFLYGAPIACVDVRYRGILDEDPPMGTPTLDYSPEKCAIFVRPAENVWWILDILRSLLSDTDVRTQVASISVDLSMFEQHGSDLVSRTFARVHEHLQEAKVAGKALEVVEVIHTAESKDELDLVPLDELRRLVSVGVIVDGTMHGAT